MKTKYGRMIYDFDAASEAELSAKEGDMVAVIEDHNDGWCTCSPVSNDSSRGFIPTAYFDIVDNYSPPSTATPSASSLISKSNISANKIQFPVTPSAASKPALGASSTTTSTTKRISTVLKTSNNSNNSSDASQPSSPTPSISSPVSVTISSSSSSGSGSGNKKKESRGAVAKLKLSESSAKSLLAKQLKVYTIKLKLRNYCKSTDFKQRRTRNELIRETVETERTYVKHLSNFVNLVYLPIKKAQKPVIKEENIKSLFSNVEQILSINNMLLNDLEKAMTMWPESRIGLAFKNIAPFLKTYTTYVNNYDTAFEQYELLLKKKPKFKDFLNDQVYSNAATERYKFDSYLILPVQRIPRYRMLIADILKNTPSEHVEFKDLTDSLNIITEVASFVNEGKRQNENSTVIMDLSKQVKDRYKTLVQPNRKYVRDGVFNVRCPEKSMYGDAYKVYMFSDVIVMIENRADSLFNRSKKSIYFLFFSFSTVIYQPESVDITIECMHSGDMCRFNITFPTADEAKQWKLDAEDNISQIQKNNELKGVGPSILLGKERMELNSRTKQTLKKCGDILQDFRQTEQNLLRLDSELRRDQEELKRLQLKIEKERQEIAQAEDLLNQLENNQKKEVGVLSSQFGSLRDKDSTVLYALKEEAEAFRQIFGEEPSTEDLHTKLIPSGIVRQKRIPMEQASFESTDTSSKGPLPPPMLPNSAKPKILPKPITPTDEKPVPARTQLPPPRPTAHLGSVKPSEISRTSSSPTLPVRPSSLATTRASLPAATSPLASKALPKPLPQAGSPASESKPVPPPRKLPMPSSTGSPSTPPTIVFRKK